MSTSVRISQTDVNKLVADRQRKMKKDQLVREFVGGGLDLMHTDVESVVEYIHEYTHIFEKYGIDPVEAVA